jgi:DNA-binding FrmR family transcriptional regulator
LHILSFRVGYGLSERHASHPDIIKRLKRAHGHLASVIAMIEAERPCLDLAQQIHAVESAVSNAKRTLINDHMEHCLGDGGGKTVAARAAMEEFS